MPGRRSSAGRGCTGVRKLSASQYTWRKASATEVFEAGGLAISRGNGFIDPDKAVGKLKNHGRGLWRMQAFLAFVMSLIAVITDTRYGLTYWYANTAGGGKLRDMQYAWAFFNTICAIFGVWVYMLWNEAVACVHRERRLFRQKVHIWMSYFTWAFGIWTTAVVFVSFKSYSFSGNYPTDLTCSFIGAALCCVLSDTWALGKLCSLGTYAARLEEEWRLMPHEPTASPMSNLVQDLGEATDGFHKGKDQSINAFKRLVHLLLPGRRASGSRAEAPVHQGGHSEDNPMHGGKQTIDTVGLVAISAEDVLMPHAFERLWNALETQGEFQTRIRNAVTQTAVVRHLNEIGFQVVAAGTVDGTTRVLFCAKEATTNGTGAWFLAELLQDETNLTLEATFKSKTPSVVPGFVKSFMLQTIFTIAEP